MSTNNAAHTPGPWRATEGASGPDFFHIEQYNERFERVEDVAFLSLKPSNGSLKGNACLIAAAPELLEALREGRRAIGDHFAPNDCYATGPLTGDNYRDLVQCPACSFIAMYEAAIAKATGSAK